MEDAMRKLNLDLDALVVDSFETDAPVVARGTVQANEAIDTGVYSCARTCRCPSHHNTECC
jgi:hypothetical protein